MAVGILLLTHPGIGTALRAVVLYGASPSNLAARLESTPVTVRRVSGLNLPMLLRVLNYPEQNLDALAQTAVTGARSGVVNGHA